MNLERLVSLIAKSVPYSDQVTYCEFADKGEEGCSVIFNWRSSSFIVSIHKGVSGFCVGEYKDGFSVGTDSSLLLRSLLTCNHVCSEDF